MYNTTTDSNRFISMDQDFIFDPIFVTETGKFKADIVYSNLNVDDAKITVLSGIDKDEMAPVIIDGEVLEYTLDSTSTMLQIRLTGIVYGEYIKLQYSKGSATTGEISIIKYLV